jgi:hypothetical protein
MHALALFGEEAGQSGPVRARALDREGAVGGGMGLREPEQAPVAARRGGKPGLHEQDAATGGGDDGERVGVPMCVDADHEVHVVCEHLSYLPIDGGKCRCRSGDKEPLAAVL